MTRVALLICALLLVPAAAADAKKRKPKPPRVLVYSGTVGFRHNSIPFGKEVLDHLSRLDAMYQNIVKQVVLFQLSFGQPDREMRCVNGNVKFFEDEGQRAQVVFVPVCQDDGRDVIPVLFKEVEVGDGHVDAVNALFREAHPGVDDDHLVLVAHGHTIHPELADTAERDDL